MAFATSIVDMVSGRPAAGVRVRLEQQEPDAWRAVDHGVSDAEGRVTRSGRDDWKLGSRGVYRFTFETNAYFAELGQATDYPEVAVQFLVADPHQQSRNLVVLIAPHAYMVCTRRP